MCSVNGPRARRITGRFSGFLCVVFALLALAAQARAEVPAETAQVLNTLSFLVHGFLVLLMATGFAMLGNE